MKSPRKVKVSVIHPETREVITTSTIYSQLPAKEVKYRYWLMFPEYSIKQIKAEVIKE